MIKSFIVDSFTNTPFQGNPAGVCILEAPLSERQMLHIAQELNLSETAFIQQQDSSTACSIRYFSPKMEIPLCGHATLAAAKVLFTTRSLPEVHFITIQQLDLLVRSRNDAILMDFPRYTTTPSEAPAALLMALGLTTINNAVYNKETNILMLEIADPALLAQLEPDFNALYHSHNSINGVLVTARAGNDGYDFHSRYFWPWSGSNEDPVTGGTHTFLTPYWAERLGKTSMNSFQSSKRTGSMQVELLETQVQILGQACIVLEGNLYLT